MVTWGHNSARDWAHIFAPTLRIYAAAAALSPTYVDSTKDYTFLTRRACYAGAMFETERSLIPVQCGSLPK